MSRVIETETIRWYLYIIRAVLYVGVFSLYAYLLGLFGANPSPYLSHSWVLFWQVVFVAGMGWCFIGGLFWIDVAFEES